MQERTILRDEIASAFRMNNQAALTWHEASDQQESVQNLEAWIFGTDPEIQNKALEHYMDLYNGAKESFQAEKPVQDEIIIYCGATPREFKVTDDPDPRNPSGKITHFQDLHFSGWGDALSVCQAQHAVAFATQDPWGKRSCVTLCPFYLERVLKEKMPLRKRWGGTTGKDGIMLDGVDKTILHELIHTTVGGKAADIDGSTAYGWNYIGILQSEGEAGWNNADSLADYARGVDMIINGHYTITECGDVCKKEEGKDQVCVVLKKPAV